MKNNQIYNLIMGYLRGVFVLFFTTNENVSHPRKICSVLASKDEKFWIIKVKNI